jgi:hypothetical protein
MIAFPNGDEISTLDSYWTSQMKISSSLFLWTEFRRLNVFVEVFAMKCVNQKNHTTDWWTKHWRNAKQPRSGGSCSYAVQKNNLAGSIDQRSIAKHTQHFYFWSQSVSQRKTKLNELNARIEFSISKIGFPTNLIYRNHACSLVQLSQKIAFFRKEYIALSEVN